MKKQDDRTEAQRLTHYRAVVARDKFMSGWGGASGGASRCAWAYNPAELTGGKDDRLFNWVKDRKEMRNVILVDLRTYRAPKGTAHFHIYVAGPEHPGCQ